MIKPCWFEFCGFGIIKCGSLYALSAWPAHQLSMMAQKLRVIVSSLHTDHKGNHQTPTPSIRTIHYWMVLAHQLQNQPRLMNKSRTVLSRHLENGLPKQSTKLKIHLTFGFNFIEIKVTTFKSASNWTNNHVHLRIVFSSEFG